MGIIFGIILVKSEVISWYRIQEMFRLQSFHMFGVIGSAVVTGIISILIIKRFKIKTISGENIELPAKKFNKGQIYGGLIFGFGWAITGACPGPLYAQIGSGSSVIIITLLSAVAGTWVYGILKKNCLNNSFQLKNKTFKIIKTKRNTLPFALLKQKFILFYYKLKFKKYFIKIENNYTALCDNNHQIEFNVLGSLQCK